MTKTSIENVRHSLAHLLAAAVLELYPDAKRTIGPAIDNGFYFDFEFPTNKPAEEDLSKIEEKMREILKTWKNFERIDETEDSVKEFYKNNPYKLELIDEIAAKGEKLTSYKSGDYIDLCRGGHVENMEDIDPESFTLTHIAGAYWRGSEKNPMLTRIYGLAFHTKKELKEHVVMLEEAKKRDHKKLGPELDLFTFSDLVGAGLPLWTPNGTLLRNILDDFVGQLRKERGYVQVDIPHITKKDLYEKSGHWDKFKDELFRIKTREGHEFAMKPMNCPHHTQIYARRQWSYRELPQRYANTTKVYRDEQSGELAGLSRTRSFTQDDAHVFCLYEQIPQEIQKIWEIIQIFYGAVGFDLQVRLSLHDPNQMDKYLGEEENWEKAENILRDVVIHNNTTAMEAIGEAAFYGPKIDFMAKDSIGREWQVATIQLDFNMPVRFDLTYISKEGQKERVAMIHAAIMGSIERYLSILIEHFAGAFPAWLSPVQAVVVPISDKQADWAGKVHQQLKDAGIRAEINADNETLGKRIRESEKQKVPYVLVVGDKEIEANAVAVRQRGKGDLGQIKVGDFISTLKDEISQRK